ncbi:MAG TPA: glycogen synthase GlgA [Amaricoccus sp.]|uniref:glycogen synthase GlgA n=1 Tax=Amaricoccus sp. TaxID=1872485 RepID=UPI002C9AA3BA|nr:glycogen synthase GlgA [Amaricoccus sp.]HMQ93285.1 glycogen synthase GlgA [Amaricoccus sp.]HMR54311.1 glycogen synthase GlgA [Amaricoccus sp.]HMR60112.1 glycogen synthase GlgA [Amaricoccus sp.]HMU01284.1 glycogen synthase GlgA [Amaricoccus sp.]
MKVLSVTSEIYPLIKTGGLADVAGALPPALGRLGIAVRSLVPGYPSVTARAKDGEVLHSFPALLGAPARLIGARIAGLDLIVLDAPELFERSGGPYADGSGHDHPDNWRRFAALARAGAEIAAGLLPDFVPDIVHAHDWQAALTPAYLRYFGIGVPSIVTVHNLAFQGQFPAAIFGALELPGDAYSFDGVEYYGGVGFLKAGLQCATAITTVSPTYAAEIRTASFGMGLDGLIQHRAAAVHGIVNGIDTEVWDPATDSLLAANYGARNLKGRQANRRAVEAAFSLDRDDAPIFVMVSRLTWQKGADLLLAVVDELVAAGGKLAVLGTGESALESAFLAASAHHRGRIGASIAYDERLAHLVQGGGDAILIPSRFEPCGLTQLCGLRYGCVPVVARTGGLADTVVDANTAALNAGVATGIQFPPSTAEGLRDGLRRCLALFASPKQWTTMQRQGMKADVSWDRSAALYAELFASLTSDRGPTA